MSFFETLQQNFPVAARYFKGSLTAHKLPHGLVFKTQDAQIAYDSALWLAQILNCTDSQTPCTPCGHCMNCKWILKNQHPEVITLSRLTYQMEKKSDGSPKPLSPEDYQKMLTKNAWHKQILTAQVEALLQQLNRSSAYNRVIIFCDAEPGEEAELPTLSPTYYPAPAEWASITEIPFRVRPLNHGLFNAASANRFLKTLEEAPPLTLFIFITDHESSLMETIVSRCQVIPFYQAETIESSSFAAQWIPVLQRQLAGGGSAHRGEWFETVGLFLAACEKHAISPLQAIEKLSTQWYLHGQASGYFKDRTQFSSYCRVQHQLEQLRLQLLAKVNAESALLDFFSPFFEMAL